VQKRFEEWVILGKVDIEELVSTTCNTYEDFENNFKMVKLKGNLQQIRLRYINFLFFVRFTDNDELNFLSKLCFFICFE